MKIIFSKQQYQQIIAHFCNIKFEKRKYPEHVYLDYKTHGNVEQAIDAFKNIIEADHSYMQDEKSLEAWTFIYLLALQWYYDLSERLKQHRKVVLFRTDTRQIEGGRNVWCCGPRGFIPY